MSNIFGEDPDENALSRYFEAQKGKQYSGLNEKQILEEIRDNSVLKDVTTGLILDPDKPEAPENPTLWLPKSKLC